MSERQVGEEARKSQALRLENGFIDTYLSGEEILDIGYKGYIDDVVPIVPQAKGIELDYPGYDGRTLPFPDNSQDAVFASHCLEHIADFQNAFRDWHRVLKVGGFMVIMVPHQFLYEKRVGLPSRFNADHKRFYTPGSLMGDVEMSLQPNSYRLRHLVDNDRDFTYEVPSGIHSGGCYEIELVVEKTGSPDWSLELYKPARTQRGDFDAIAAGVAQDAANGRRQAIQAVEVVAASPYPVAVYDFGRRTSPRRVLVIKLDHLDEFIIGIPALRELRNLLGDARIDLVCSPGSQRVAEAGGLVDTVATYTYFPENTRDWDGRPVESEAVFDELVSGRYDLAIDLRAGPETRQLLERVDAGTRCGIGVHEHFPFLDINLPPQHVDRTSDKDLHGGDSISIGIERFKNRMTRFRPFVMETDFSITDTHVVYGPYIPLPLGYFRAFFGLEASISPLNFKPSTVTIEVVNDRDAVVAQRSLPLGEIDLADPGRLSLEFANNRMDSRHEFRIHVAGRPRRSRLGFSGVRLDRIESPAGARLKPVDLHLGEQLSLLVQLVGQRVRQGHAADATTSVAASPALSRIVVAPSGSSSIREWPVEHYIALVRLIVERTSCEVTLVGLRPQSSTLDHIARETGGEPRVRALGKYTDWNDVSGTLQTTDLVVCNNSEIAQLAASSGVTTLALYSASHQPREWGPRGPRSRAMMAVVPCSPCGFDRVEQCPHEHACMQEMTPETVFRQVMASLEAHRPS